MDLLRDSIVIDGCAFAGGDFPGYTKRMATASLNGVSLTIPHSHDGFRAASTSIGRIHQLVDEQSEKLSLAKVSKDIEDAQRTSRTAVILAFQDPAPIENSLELLRVFYELGVRIVQLTYNKANYIGTGCAETEDRGLTDFGRRVVREMNRLGIVIDCSHCSPKTTLEALERSEHPVIFSHANVRAISNNPRNHSDEELERLAKKGGVCGLTPWGPICWKKDKNEPPSLDDYLDHVEHIVRLLGDDHVGFGTDNTLDGAADEEGTKAQGRLYPEVVGEYDRRVGTKPKVRYARGFAGHHELANVVNAMTLRKYSEERIQKFLGANFLRVFKEVWKA
jgi:membrane dipeptidase